MILLAFLAAAGQPGETPRGFMERLYSNYRQKDFSPFTHADRVFAPSLLAAINEDSRLAHGEVGYLDGDPVCQCQDTRGMRPSITGVSTEGADRATVRVSIRWENDKPTSATFRLIRTPRGWRIADVATSGQPSLLKDLEAVNRRARKH
jgi:hypothetical protein